MRCLARETKTGPGGPPLRFCSVARVPSAFARRFSDRSSASLPVGSSQPSEFSNPAGPRQLTGAAGAPRVASQPSARPRANPRRARALELPGRGETRFRHERRPDGLTESDVARTSGELNVPTNTSTPR